MSGYPNENSTTFTIMVVANDIMSGNANQTFIIYVSNYSLSQSYLALIIVCCLLFLFIMVVVVVLCRRNLKKCRKKKQTSGGEDDSYEDDDDICIEETKPKNPFRFKKEMETATHNDETER